jgi:hypothetical protein
MGTGKYRNTVYTVDFSLAKEFCKAKRYKDFRGRPFSGISHYVSINNYSGCGNYPG